MKKILALGNQEFSKVIGNNCIYVDKTELIYKLVTQGDYYFLSRPRRFGKSLLANTIKELYRGSKDLFKGLWIYDKWDWEKTYPVIKISFSSISHNVIGLEKAINVMLEDIAKKYNIKFSNEDYPNKFKELIEKLAKNTQIVIIIDEYDRPIIDYMTDIPKAEENRNILKNFYSILKDADKHIKLFFVTGVSKFSKVSMFSDLNNLIDITIDENYSKIVGWTKEEVEKYFSDHIKVVADKYKDIYPDIMPEIQKWYNGYSWDGITRVYNPVSLMTFFGKLEFGNYWFATGTPTFLIDLMKERKYTAFDLTDSHVSTKILDKYELTNISFLPLLFQTGYLTIKHKDLRTRRITLGYPNFEVEEAFSIHLLSMLTFDKIDKTEMLLFKIIDSFTDNEIDSFIEYINILLIHIPYTIADGSKENYYHSLFFLIMKMVGFNIDVEILIIKGRIDAVIRTDDNIYVIEFKINQSAKTAIKQIKDKQYALKYADDKQPIILLGINFDTEKKQIEDYLIENY